MGDGAVGGGITVLNVGARGLSQHLICVSFIVFVCRKEEE